MPYIVLRATMLALASICLLSHPLTGTPPSTVERHSRLQKLGQHGRNLSKKALPLLLPLLPLAIISALALRNDTSPKKAAPPSTSLVAARPLLHPSPPSSTAFIPEEKPEPQAPAILFLEKAAPPPGSPFLDTHLIDEKDDAAESIVALEVQILATTAAAIAEEYGQVETITSSVCSTPSPLKNVENLATLQPTKETIVHQTSNREAEEKKVVPEPAPPSASTRTGRGLIAAIQQVIKKRKLKAVAQKQAETSLAATAAAIVAPTNHALPALENIEDLAASQSVEEAATHQTSSMEAEDKKLATHVAQNQGELLTAATIAASQELAGEKEATMIAATVKGWLARRHLQQIAQQQTAVMPAEEEVGATLKDAEENLPPEAAEIVQVSQTELAACIVQEEKQQLRTAAAAAQEANEREEKALVIGAWLSRMHKPKNLTAAKSYVVEEHTEQATEKQEAPAHTQEEKLATRITQQQVQQLNTVANTFHENEEGSTIAVATTIVEERPVQAPSVQLHQLAQAHTATLTAIATHEADKEDAVLSCVETAASMEENEPTLQILANTAIVTETRQSQLLGHAFLDAEEEQREKLARETAATYEKNKKALRELARKRKKSGKEEDLLHFRENIRNQLRIIKENRKALQLFIAAYVPGKGPVGSKELKALGILFEEISALDHEAQEAIAVATESMPRALLNAKIASKDTARQDRIVKLYHEIITSFMNCITVPGNNLATALDLLPGYRTLYLEPSEASMVAIRAMLTKIQEEKHPLNRYGLSGRHIACIITSNSMSPLKRYAQKDCAFNNEIEELCLSVIQEQINPEELVELHNKLTDGKGLTKDQQSRRVQHQLILQLIREKISQRDGTRQSTAVEMHEELQ